MCASGNLNISAVFLLSAITRNHSTSLISTNIRKLIIIGMTDKRTYICALKPNHSLIFICIFVFAWYQIWKMPCDSLTFTFCWDLFCSCSVTFCYSLTYDICCWLGSFVQSKRASWNHFISSFILSSVVIFPGKRGLRWWLNIEGWIFLFPQPTFTI